MEKENIINIVYSSDDNYILHAAVSIVSLLENNDTLGKINVYFIENNVSDENKHQINTLMQSYKELSIKWIEFSKWMKKLNLNMEWEISISSYARLFIAEMLGDDIDKVLYLDCDIIVNHSIKKLMDIDIADYYIGAVQDAVNDETKNSVGLQSNKPYYNAGMLLINLKKWREDNLSERFLSFIDEHQGSVTHHDQGVINGVLKDKILKLPLKYNVMTIHYIFNRKQIMKYYRESTEFYSQEEIKIAKNNPIILHYTPSFTVRPWVRGCKHPKKGVYWLYLNKTPWKNVKRQKNGEKWYIRVTNFLYRNFYR